MTGTEMGFCEMVKKDNAACFCRSYNPNAAACNENPKMLLNAINLLMSERGRLISRELMLHWLNLKQKLRCHSGPFYASISVNWDSKVEMI
ncbi:unnamed protein product [Onchocerca flexuosa]|uniref:Uncharacterized protein n=1 Tax=Onchocerca flexuosa TaxID=387005 RepID=A0A183H117_9BILA|nr:unnamed protein product [Onchocerca flexuosa]